jgi:hypothetical protein
MLLINFPSLNVYSFSLSSPLLTPQAMETPLHLLPRHAPAATARILLERGADVDALDQV